MAITKLTEFYIDGDWVDATSSVRGPHDVAITRSRRGEGTQVQPTLVNLTLNDRSGDWSNNYPLSPYYRKLGRNTLLRQSMGKNTILSDDFNRSVSNAWTGGSFTWTNSGGTVPDDYDINGTHGTHTHTAANTLHHSHVDTGERNHRVRALWKLSAGTVTGASAFVYIAGRMTDTNNYYYARAEITTGGSVALSIRKVVSGVDLPIADAVTTHAGYSGLFATNEFYVEFYVIGRFQYAKIWDSAHDEPLSWNVSSEDSGLPTGNLAGLIDRRNTGNTNANLQFQYNSFYCMPGTIRATVEVPEWPHEWDGTGTDIYAKIQGAGIKRRLSQGGIGGGAKPLKSPTYREVTRKTQTGLIAYWPCEDGSDSTELGAGITTHGPMRIVGGTPALGSYDDFPGSAAVINMGAAPTPVLHAFCPNSTDTGTLKFRMYLSVPTGGFASNQILADLYTKSGTGSIRLWRLRYDTAGSGSLQLQGLDSTFTVVEDSGAFGFGVNGEIGMIGFEVTENGADVDYEIAAHLLEPDGTAPGGVGTGTFTAQTVGIADEVYIGPNQGLASAGVGHIIIGNSSLTVDGLEDAFTGWINETAAQRIERLTEEEGALVEVLDDPYVTAMTMGPQRTDTLLNLLLDVEKADGGILLEPRHFFGLQYKTRAYIYSTSATLELDYSLGHFSGQFKPVQSDKLLRLGNDVTAVQYDGGYARYEKTSGTLNTNEKSDDPDGVGRYDTRQNFNTNLSLANLKNVASWQAHIATWDEDSLDGLKIELHRNVFAVSQSLTSSVVEHEIGEVMSIANPLSPPMPPDDILAMTQGYSERISNLTWEISFNTAPAGPWRVARLDSDDFGKLDTAGCEVAAAFTAGGTSLLANTTEDHSNPRYWTIDSGEYPFHIKSVGQVLNATACARGATDTFTRVVAAGSWGSPTTSYPGTAYSLNGTAADFSVTGVLGRIATVTTNQEYIAHYDSESTDCDHVYQITLPVLPTGAAITLRVYGRLTDASNYYLAEASVATTGVVTFSLIKRVAGAATGLGSVTLQETHSAGNTWNIRLKVSGSKLRARAWKSTTTEYKFWHVQATDTALTTGTRNGCGVRRETGNTNGTQNIDFDNHVLYNPQIFTVDAASVYGLSKNLAVGDAINLERPAIVGL